MRVTFAYGMISSGGCERRMGDLMEWLLRNGDECWLLASGMNDMGRTMMFRQCGIPPDRIKLMEPGGNYEEFLTETARELEADIMDAQWTQCLPSEFLVPTVFTMHGVSQPIPETAPFAGIISVEPLDLQHLAYHRAPTRIISNWVNLERFPFREDLGEGACFLGRAFKTVNAKKVCLYDPDVIVDCYGTVHAAGELGDDWPPNARWLGCVVPEEVIYDYRVVFASAMTALEAIAAGRLVIAGQHYDGRIPWGSLVRPSLLVEMSRDQFASISQPRFHDDPEPTAAEVYAEYMDAMENDYLNERRVCRTYVEEHHDKEKQCRKIRDFYEEVLA